MKLTARYAVLIVTVIIVTLFSASCAPRTNVALVSTPQPTSTITATQIVTPTPKPTITPIPTESPVPTISSEEAAIINQQIQDFLQYKGKYSQENIQSYLYPTSESFYKLGVIYDLDTTIKIQGWLFGYTMQADDLLLIVGFDSKRSNRFVTALKIPLYYECSNTIGWVGIDYQRDWNENTYFHSGENARDYETIISHLVLDQPFLFYYFTNIPSDEESKEKGYSESSIKLFHEMRDNLQYAYNLVSRLEPNNQAVQVPSSAKNFPISEIDEVSDLVELDRLTIPTLDVLVCIDG